VGPEPVLEAADTAAAAPALVEASRVWARNQRVTALVVPEEGEAAAVVGVVVEPLAALLDRRYRQWAQSRMYISGHDTALADTLRSSGGSPWTCPTSTAGGRTSDSMLLLPERQPGRVAAGAVAHGDVASRSRGRDHDRGRPRLARQRGQASTTGSSARAGPAPDPGAPGRPARRRLEVRGAWSGAASTTSPRPARSSPTSWTAPPRTAATSWTPGSTLPPRTSTST
jgi:hypothetical protein